MNEREVVEGAEEEVLGGSCEGQRRRKDAVRKGKGRR